MCALGPTMRVVAMTVLLHASCGFGAAEERLDLEPFLGTQWYGLYVLAQKAGYMQWTADLGELGGAPVVVQEERALLLMGISGEERAVRFESRRVYEGVPPYRLILVENEERTRDSTRRLRVEREGDEFVITELLHGRRTTKRVPASNETLHDCRVIERFILGGPKPGDTVRLLSFDGDELEDVEETARLFEIVEEKWRGEPRRVFVVEVRGAGPGWVKRYLDDGTLICASHGGALTLKLEDEAAARRMPAKGELFEVRRRIPVKGLDVKGEDVLTLTLAISGVPEGVLLDLPRQRVKRREDGALVVTLTPGAVPAEPLLTDEDRERLAEYLEATDEIQAGHRRIRKRARRMVRGTSDPLEQARKISRWVHRHVEDVAFSDYETALDVLIHLKGDCTEHTLLFVALCRAAGLPAREVSGLVYGGPAVGTFGMHRWAQVYVGEWVDVDPSLGQFPADATHIVLDTEGDGWFELLAAFPDIRIEVLSVE